MQLRETEAVGVLDDHDRRVGNIDADLDHGRRHEHVDVAGAERVHHRFLLARRQLPVEQTEAETRELLLSQTLELLGGGFRLGARRALDQRAHDVRLPAGFDLGAKPLVGGGAFERAGADHLRGHRRPARGHLPQLGLVEVAVDEHGGGARDGRGRHDEDVRPSGERPGGRSRGSP